MTALDASTDSEDTKPTPAKEPTRAAPTTPRDASGDPSGRNKAPKRATSSPWCCAMLWTVLIVVFAYVALYWTDPEQIAMRQRAWEATMRKLRMEKTVVHASRWVQTWHSRSFSWRGMLLPLHSLVFDQRSYALTPYLIKCSI